MRETRVPALVACCWFLWGAGTLLAQAPTGISITQYSAEKKLLVVVTFDAPVQKNDTIIVVSTRLRRTGKRIFQQSWPGAETSWKVPRAGEVQEKKWGNAVLSEGVTLAAGDAIDVQLKLNATAFPSILATVVVAGASAAQAPTSAPLAPTAAVPSAVPAPTAAPTAVAPLPTSAIVPPTPTPLLPTATPTTNPAISPTPVPLRSFTPTPDRSATVAAQRSASAAPAGTAVPPLTAGAPAAVPTEIPPATASPVENEITPDATPAVPAAPAERNLDYRILAAIGGLALLGIILIVASRRRPRVHTDPSAAGSAGQSEPALVPAAPAKHKAEPLPGATVTKRAEPKPPAPPPASEVPDPERTLVQRVMPHSPLRTIDRADAVSFDSLNVERKLATGGICEIYLAPHAGGTCVVKALRPQFRQSREMGENLIAEGALLAILNAAYPNEPFIGVYEQGWIADPARFHPYIKLEYVDGENLKELVKKFGAFAPGDVLDVSMAIMLALCAVHDEEFVHGDVSPENIMVMHGDSHGVRGRYRLIDFGDARKFDFDSRAREIAGKPHFMSPEQCDGFPATPSSDIYAFGMLFYYLTFGRPAFDADDTMAIFSMHRMTPLKFPDGASPEVKRFLHELCAKLPLQRPAAADVLKRLEALGARRKR